jgi:hypothetical protein
MVEIMKADNGYIVLDDVDGVRIESDFNSVIDWLREQFNEYEQPLSTLGIGSGEYYVISNTTSDDCELKFSIECDATKGIGRCTEREEQYPVTLDVRPIESTVGT